MANVFIDCKLFAFDKLNSFLFENLKKRAMMSTRSTPHGSKSHQISSCMRNTDLNLINFYYIFKPWVVISESYRCMNILRYFDHILDSKPSKAKRRMKGILLIHARLSITACSKNFLFISFFLSIDSLFFFAFPRCWLPFLCASTRVSFVKRSAVIRCLLFILDINISSF